MTTEIDPKVDPPAGETPPPEAPPETPPETVSRAEFERVMSDMHKFKADARAAREQADRLKMQGLKEKDDWKNVATEYETKYKEAQTRYEQIQVAIVTDKKMSVLKLEAKKAGILDSALEDLELVDFPELTAETTSTGRMNVLGADRAIQRLKVSRPHWFSKAAPNINPNAPDTTNTGGKVGYTELQKLVGEAQKSGDWSAYREKLPLYDPSLK